MLNAKLHGKADFAVSEDVLTDMVFTRLSYLEGPVLWGVLQRCFNVELQYGGATLSDIEFWPRWDDDPKLREGQVLPDCVLRFKFGEAPKQKQVAIILEAKRHAHTKQRAGQWHRQWQAFQQLQDDGDEEADEAIFLALGGLGENPSQQVAQLKEAVDKHGGPPIPAYGALGAPSDGAERAAQPAPPPAKGDR